MTDKVSSSGSSAFNQLKVTVPKQAEAGPEQTKASTELRRATASALQQSARNNEQAAETITSISAVALEDPKVREVAEANQSSARSEVRDVEEAAALADKVAQRISSRGQEALAAFKAPSPDVVKSLLN